jgi:hypothetical protein
MASRQASLGRGPARPLEASVKAIEVFDDPTLAKIAAVLDYEQPIWQPHTARDARQERSGSSKAGRGTYRCLPERAPRRAAPSRSDIALASRRRKQGLSEPQRASASLSDGEPLPLAPAPRPQPSGAGPQPAARPLAVAAARPLAAPRAEPVADARQDRRRHGRARHGYGLSLERPRLRVHQAGAFYRVLYSKGV